MRLTEQIREHINVDHWVPERITVLQDVMAHLSIHFHRIGRLHKIRASAFHGGTKYMGKSEGFNQMLTAAQAVDALVTEIFRAKHPEFGMDYMRAHGLDAQYGVSPAMMVAAMINDERNKAMRELLDSTTHEPSADATESEPLDAEINEHHRGFNVCCDAAIDEVTPRIFARIRSPFLLPSDGELAAARINDELRMQPDFGDPIGCDKKEFDELVKGLPSDPTDAPLGEDLPSDPTDASCETVVKTYDARTALLMLKSGKLMARKGWPTGMFLYAVKGSKFTVSRAPLLGIFPEGTEIEYREHIDIHIANGVCGTWSPTAEEAKADDWIEVEVDLGNKQGPLVDAYPQKGSGFFGGFANGYQGAAR